MQLKKNRSRPLLQQLLGENLSPCYSCYCCRAAVAGGEILPLQLQQGQLPAPAKQGREPIKFLNVRDTENWIVHVVVQITVS